jgi:hypothetical protein
MAQFGYQFEDGALSWHLTHRLPTKDNKNQVSTHFLITTHDYSAENQGTNFLNQQVLK